MDNSVLLYQAEDGSLKTEVPIHDDTVWLTQKQMAELFNKNIRTINEHIKNVYSEQELTPDATIRKFRIVCEEGQRMVGRDIEHYNLDSIISIGYREKSIEALQNIREEFFEKINELKEKIESLDSPDDLSETSSNAL